MSEHLQEALSVIQTDVIWFEDAAKHVEELASKLDSREKAKWRLIATVYYERAKLHTDLLNRLSSCVTISKNPASTSNFIT